MVALDVGRRPAEMLDFFAIKAGMTVLDLPADEGYYSELIARRVGPNGKVITLIPDSLRASFADLAARNANIELRSATMHGFTPETVTPSEVDFALLHLMYHDTYWDEPGAPRVEPRQFLAALYRTLRPGGVVGVIDYAGEPGDTRAIVNRLHRIAPATAKADFERAGFIFEQDSTLLRRRDDDHSRSVFDPSLRGRADLFVFRFRKPAGGASAAGGAPSRDCDECPCQAE
jgi:predicted methyltransferase